MSCPLQILLMVQKMVYVLNKFKSSFPFSSPPRLCCAYSLCDDGLLGPGRSAPNNNDANWWWLWCWWWFMMIIDDDVNVDDDWWWLMIQFWWLMLASNSTLQPTVQSCYKAPTHHWHFACQHWASLLRGFISSSNAHLADASAKLPILNIEKHSICYAFFLILSGNISYVYIIIE